MQIKDLESKIEYVKPCDSEQYCRKNESASGGNDLDTCRKDYHIQIPIT